MIGWPKNPLPPRMLSGHPSGTGRTPLRFLRSLARYFASPVGLCGGWQYTDQSNVSSSSTASHGWVSQKKSSCPRHSDGGMAFSTHAHTFTSKPLIVALNWSRSSGAFVTKM